MVPAIYLFIGPPIVARIGYLFGCEYISGERTAVQEDAVLRTLFSTLVLHGCFVEAKRKNAVACIVLIASDVPKRFKYFASTFTSLTLG